MNLPLSIVVLLIGIGLAVHGLFGSPRRRE